MTSKLKCPFCGEELTEYPVWGFGCGNTNCACSEGVVGSEQLWLALIQAKQDLEIARKALKEIDWCAQDYAKAQETLDEITALEQKDVK